jgi:hypothetical protein
MAKYTLEVIKEFKLKNNLRYFVIDNADNNNTLLTYLSLSLQRKHNVKFDPKHYRLRC